VVRIVLGEAEGGCETRPESCEASAGVAFILAGGIAQLFAEAGLDADPRQGRLSPGDSANLDLAFAGCPEFARRPGPRKLELETKMAARLLRRHWPAVQEIARTLLADNELTAEQVREIMGEVSDEAPEEANGCEARS